MLSHWTEPWPAFFFFPLVVVRVEVSGVHAGTVRNLKEPPRSSVAELYGHVRELTSSTLLHAAQELARRLYSV